MTKGTRTFRIIISVLLGLTMLWTAYISYAFIYYAKDMHAQEQNERYGLYVAGVDVTHGNAHDILGDGTASYNAKYNRLTLNNAAIECEGSAIYSEIDLTVELTGENKFTCRGKDFTYAVYASDVSLKKSISFTGDGTLDILVDDESCVNNAGIVADDLWISSDISITLTNAEDQSDGISCSFLNLAKDNTLTVKAGSAKTSTGIFVRGDIILESNSSLDVAGMASEKSSCGIECTGTIMAYEGSTITAVSGSNRAGIICYSTFADGGATVNAEIDAIDGICEMK